MSAIHKIISACYWLIGYARLGLNFSRMFRVSEVVLLLRIEG